MNLKPPELQLRGRSETRRWNHNEVIKEMEREGRYSIVEIQITQKIIRVIKYNFTLVFVLSN